MKVSFSCTIYRGVISPLAHQAGKVSVGFSKFKPAEILDVVVSRQTKTRTLPQNKRFWRIMQTFEALGWEKNEAKVWLCGEFLDPVVREFPDGSRTETVRGTSKLTTKEMGEFMDAIERFLNQRGLWYPEAEEHHGR